MLHRQRTEQKTFEPRLYPAEAVLLHVALHNPAHMRIGREEERPAVEKLIYLNLLRDIWDLFGCWALFYQVSEIYQILMNGSDFVGLEPTAHFMPIINLSIDPFAWNSNFSYFVSTTNKGDGVWQHRSCTRCEFAFVQKAYMDAQIPAVCHAIDWRWSPPQASALALAILGQAPTALPVEVAG